ncbi:MAG: Uma2 family endonuclease [Planctomycetota bacterium]
MPDYDPSDCDESRVYPDVRSVVFTASSWRLYWALRLGVNHHTKITFDRDRIEVERSENPPGRSTDIALLRSLIDFHALETGTKIHGSGGITLAHEPIAGGCEPDGSWYVRAEPPPPGTEQIDLIRHNAPDLVIEVDLSRWRVDKEPVYFRLGVAEVWRWENQRLQVRALGDDGYVDADASELLPGLPIDALGDCMRSARTTPQHEVVKRWRDQVNG